MSRTSRCAWNGCWVARIRDSRVRASRGVELRRASGPHAAAVAELVTVAPSISIRIGSACRARPWAGSYDSAARKARAATAAIRVPPRVAVTWRRVTIRHIGPVRCVGHDQRDQRVEHGRQFPWSCLARSCAEILRVGTFRTQGRQNLRRRACDVWSAGRNIDTASFRNVSFLD